MSLPEAIREQVRLRAGSACEFCGVTETDAGGCLTIDHFQPAAQGGGDAPDNLIYCCPRCNQYKADYWPGNPMEPHLWNPRKTPYSAHFFEMEDGTLHWLTEAARFTLRRLRLNRPPLVAHRLHRQVRAEEIRWLARHRDLIEVLKQLNRQQAVLLEEQQQLLEAQRKLLLRLLAGG